MDARVRNSEAVHRAPAYSVREVSSVGAGRAIQGYSVREESVCKGRAIQGYPAKRGGGETKESEPNFERMRRESIIISSLLPLLLIIF